MTSRRTFEIDSQYPLGEIRVGDVLVFYGVGGTPRDRSTKQRIPAGPFTGRIRGMVAQRAAMTERFTFDDTGSELFTPRAHIVLDIVHIPDRVVAVVRITTSAGPLWIRLAGPGAAVGSWIISSGTTSIICARPV